MTSLKTASVAAARLLDALCAASPRKVQGEIGRANDKGTLLKALAVKSKTVSVPALTTAIRNSVGEDDARTICRAMIDAGYTSEVEGPAARASAIAEAGTRCYPELLASLGSTLPNIDDCLLDTSGATLLTSMAAMPQYYLSGEQATKQQIYTTFRVALSLSPDINRVSRSGDAPLAHAAASGHILVMDALLQLGADIDAGNTRTGKTPLMHAVEGHRADAVTYLLQRGASLTARTSNGETVLDMVSHSDYSQTPTKAAIDDVVRAQNGSCVAANIGTRARQRVRTRIL